MLKKAVKRFGEIAVEKGFVTQGQVKEALSIQNELARKKKHRLIGLIMLTNDMITNSQLIDVLRCYSGQDIM